MCVKVHTGSCHVWCVIALAGRSYWCGGGTEPEVGRPPPAPPLPTSLLPSPLPHSSPFLIPEAPGVEGHLVKGSRWRRTVAAICDGPGPARSLPNARWSTISPVVRKTSVCRSSIFLPLLLLISLRPRQVIVRQVSSDTPTASNSTLPT